MKDDTHKVWFQNTHDTPVAGSTHEHLSISQPVVACRCSDLEIGVGEVSNRTI